MDPTLVARWAAVAATLLAVVVALFKEQLQSLILKPRFRADVRTRTPFCVKNASTVYARSGEGKVTALWTGNIYYSRLWIQNVGNRRAEAVEVFVTKVEQLTREGSYEPVEGFVPSNLHWANTDPVKPEVFYPMNPDMGRYCDLGSVADPACVTLQAIPGAPKGTATFDLCLLNPLPNGAHRLPPGNYQITLKISAANARPLERTVSVSISGNWTEDEDMMCTKELGLSMQS